ncbi:MAG: hypothetical protein V9E99_05440 [Microthrixaceae bacterium]
MTPWVFLSPTTQPPPWISTMAGRSASRGADGFVDVHRVPPAGLVVIGDVALTDASPLPVEHGEGGSGADGARLAGQVIGTDVG